MTKMNWCAAYHRWNYNRSHDFHALHKPCHSLPNWWALQ